MDFELLSNSLTYECRNPQLQGAARVSIALRLTPKTRATITAIAGPCIERMKAAFEEITSSSAMHTGEAAGRLDHALGALASYLGVLKEIIR